jgi:hypothetical protein
MAANVQAAAQIKSRIRVSFVDAPPARRLDIQISQYLGTIFLILG